MGKELIKIEGKNIGVKWLDAEPEFERIIAIGDIHSCSDNLKFLIDNHKPTTKDLIICVGDYMDRGPDAPGTIDFLIKLREQVPCFFLRGNHDSMFLNHFHLGGNNGKYFCHPQNGGDKTLAQYGAKIPEEHTQFILDTKIFLETENFFFSHAGFNVWSPRSYDDQTEEDYTWTREDFLYWPHKEKLDKIVVHGHTINQLFIPSWDEELMKVNLDSGAFRSGNISSITIIPADPSKCYMSVSNVKEKYFENAGAKA